jgi:hypothetical protein
MIRYALVCDKGHSFESWFKNAAAYDSQRKRALVTCPSCGSAEVEKAIMAPSVARTDKPRSAAPQAEPSPADTGAPVALVSERERELRQKLRELREHLLRDSVDVGSAFPEEARRMHYGEAEHRSIHGQASLEEAKAMAEEGIPFHALPVIPDERN